MNVPRPEIWGRRPLVDTPLPIGSTAQLFALHQSIQSVNPLYVWRFYFVVTLQQYFNCHSFSIYTPDQLQFPYVSVVDFSLGTVWCKVPQSSQ